MNRWSVWVALAKAGKGLGQTGGVQGGHSTGEVMGSWEGNGGCCSSSHSAAWGRGGVRAGLVGKESMRMQAKVSGDQRHSVRAEAEPFRMDMRKRRVLRLFKQQTASAGEASSPDLEPPRNKMVQGCHSQSAVTICHLLLLQASALEHCGDARGCCYPQGPHLQLHLCLCVLVAEIAQSSWAFSSTTGSRQEPFFMVGPWCLSHLSCHWGRKSWEEGYNLPRPSSATSLYRRRRRFLKQYPVVWCGLLYFARLDTITS